MRHPLIKEYKSRFPELFKKREVSPEVVEKLQEVLERFRDTGQNPAYSHVDSIKDSMRVSVNALRKIAAQKARDDLFGDDSEVPINAQKEIGEIKLRSQLMAYAEKKFLIILYEALKIDSGEDRISKMEEMQLARNQLAEVYADNKIAAMAANRDDADTINSEKRYDTLPQYQDRYSQLLTGTMSAYLFNMMKLKQVIPENLRAGTLYDREPASGSLLFR